MTEPARPFLSAILVTLLAAVANAASAAEDTSIVAVPDVAAVMPRHGTVSTVPASRWQDSLATGNGTLGALLAGDPRHDTLIVDHCRMWLPLGSRETLPDLGGLLPEVRRTIATKGYGDAFKLMEAHAREQGWKGLVWTDPFHPAAFITIAQPSAGAITDFARIEDFATGEARVQWRTSAGAFARREFVSRTDDAIVLTITGPKGQVTCTLAMAPIGNPGIAGTVVHDAGLITCHNTYVHGKGGYDGAVRIAVSGGTVTCDGTAVAVSGADSVTLLVRIAPWKTEDPGGLSRLTAGLGALPTDYAALLAPSAKAHGALFDRVNLDLGGGAERGLASEALLDLAAKEQRLPAALLERMYDAGRYEFICAAGPETPPNLFGIWTGTWTPAWSGDYTLDTNLQLDVEAALSGNMRESLMGFFTLLEGFVPDFRANAKAYYGCRGLFAGCRASNTGLMLHWGNGWPGQFWLPGAAWLSHWFYDYYQYTGDREFLAKRALPFMKEAALFWEDFLTVTDANGRFRFTPSFSAENGMGDNSSQDIAIVRELLTNLIAGSRALGIDPDGIQRWQGMLAKLPPYLINDQGQLKEWAIPDKGEHNNHRHLMHLYGAFETREFSEEADPVMYQAAKVALLNRIRECKERSTHGRMHMGLAAANLGLGDEAYGRLEVMGVLRSMYASMITAHEPGPDILCDDGNGAIPEIVDRLVLQSEIGLLRLLPAVPTALPRGVLDGTRVRGQIAVEHLAWDMVAGTVTAVLRSDIAQEVTLVMPPRMSVTALAADGNPLAIIAQGVRKQGGVATLPAGRSVTVTAAFMADGK